MKVSQYLLATAKEIPKDAQLVSHQLMIRAGLIRQLAAGLYTWLPLGLRVLRKIETLIRKELNAIGAIEVLLPHVIPAELWQKSGRWQAYGPELLRMKDRHDREFCFGPTHEETIVALAEQELKSYKQLPRNFYQIQTKFRDETRPRFGVMRSREFAMKDAYSFHGSKACLQKTYQDMYTAYCRIFQAMQLQFKVVEADAGAIGGQVTHEFHVLAEAGEDHLFYSNQSHYAANLEKASSLAPVKPINTPLKAITLLKTPEIRTIADLAKHHNIPAHESVKTLILKNEALSFAALILRGDHDLNLIKLKQIPTFLNDHQFATESEIRALFHAGPGSLGPVKCPIALYVDPYAAALVNFSCGANQDDHHWINVNWDRDVLKYSVVDLRNVKIGDPSPDGQGTLQHAKGIEVGHIFQLNQKYTEAMDMTVLDQNGQAIHPYMGCYGIGVSRIVAAAIEQHHDQHGIIWPEALAPFDVAIIPIGYHQTPFVLEKAEALYQALVKAGFDVILDDRNDRPGALFKDMDLLGIPHRFVISEKLLLQNNVEYKNRRSAEIHIIEQEQAASFLKTQIKNTNH